MIALHSDCVKYFYDFVVKQTAITKMVIAVVEYLFNYKDYISIL
jgi:hypothetical protein